MTHAMAGGILHDREAVAGVGDPSGSSWAVERSACARAVSSPMRVFLATSAAYRAVECSA